MPAAEPEAPTVRSSEAIQPSLALLPDIDTQFSHFTDEPVPGWLTDLDLLRDEGVLYGLSESRPEEKILAIRHCFQRLSAPLDRQVEQHNELIGELNLFIGEREQRISEGAARQAELAARQPPGEHQLPRTIAGLLLSGVMCTGTYYLLEETLRPAFQESRMISIGVFLAGMFSLFGRVSVFHDADTRLTFRRMLEEVALPFAASLFVFVQALGTQPPLRAAALFIFLFFLFLLGGKLLLGTLTVLRNDFRFLTASRALQREKLTRSVEWETEKARLNTEIDGLRVQKWQVLPQLTRLEAEMHALHARRDMLINIFESEYSLARSLKNRLTEGQRRLIRGD